MANVKLGENVYKNIHSVSMKTDSGETAIFPKYVIGTPIEIVLSLNNWSGTTYSIKLENYKVGNYGIQIGMPPEVDTETAQMMLECAFTVPYVYYTSATSSEAANTRIRISAIKTPTRDITVYLFGLEEV